MTSIFPARWTGVPFPGMGAGEEGKAGSLGGW